MQGLKCMWAHISGKCCMGGSIAHILLPCTHAGGAEFAVGQAVPQLDAVICCTGYNYSFPFLDLQVRGCNDGCMLLCCCNCMRFMQRSIACKHTDAETQAAALLHLRVPQLCCKCNGWTTLH